MERHRIDWGSATVVANGDGFSLGVPVAGPHWQDWSAVLSAAIERDGLTIAPHTWHGVSAADGHLRVDFFAADSRDRLREYLDGLVARVDEQVERAIREEERARIAAEEREREQRAAALELERWFRTTADEQPHGESEPVVDMRRSFRLGALADVESA